MIKVNVVQKPSIHPYHPEQKEIQAWTFIKPSLLGYQIQIEQQSPQIPCELQLYYDVDYQFVINTAGHPFYFSDSPIGTSSSNIATQRIGSCHTRHHEIQNKRTLLSS